ncbi:MAG: hypothetical protein WCA81_15020 [Rhizomicrobium sp.]
MRARILLGLLVVLALVPAAMAAGPGATSLDRILPEIRRHTPGTFYDAQGPFPGPDGQARYRIKWMTPDGRIIWFDADAHSGRMLGFVGGGYDRRDDQEQDRYSRQRFRNDGDAPGPFDHSMGHGNNRGRDNGHGNGGGRDRGGHSRRGGG